MSYVHLNTAESYVKHGQYWLVLISIQQFSYRKNMEADEWNQRHRSLSYDQLKMYR